MCHETGQSAFLHKQLYLSTNLDHIFLVWFVCSTSIILGTNGLNSADVPLSNEETNKLIIYSATFLGTNSLSVLMCRKAVNQSINQSMTEVEISDCRYVNKYINSLDPFLERKRGESFPPPLQQGSRPVIPGKMSILSLSFPLISPFSYSSYHVSTSPHTMVLQPSLLPPVKYLKVFRY